METIDQEKPEEEKIKIVKLLEDLFEVTEWNYIEVGFVIMTFIGYSFNIFIITWVLMTNL